MYRLGQCTLRYIRHEQDENYNPVIVTKDLIVKCSLMDSFSSNYYQSQTRDMRNSKNIVIAKTYAKDLIVDEKRYQLEYVFFGNLKYKVINILKDKKSSLHSILDCNEVING